MTTASTNAHALEISSLSVRYGGSEALRSVDLIVPSGQIVSLLGPNGAGKSTLMRAVSGLLAHHGGTIASGKVELLGADVSGDSPTSRVQRGLAQALEGRHVFPDLTVDENLATGAYVRRYRKAEAAQVKERVLSHFPRLGDLKDRKAGYLSGGEQQMLAIGRALMSQPSVLLLDEPSLGLAPRIVEDVRDVIVDINKEGTSILLVEQNAAMALSIASYGYVLESGRIVAEGTAADLKASDEIASHYLGVAPAATTTTDGGADNV